MDPYVGTFSGNDPYAGTFAGSFISRGQLIFDKDRSAPSFVPATSLWVNSTLLAWQPSPFVNSSGEVVDTYAGTLDGNAIAVTIAGDVLAFKRATDPVNPTVRITVTNENGPTGEMGLGNYVKASAPAPNYFSVQGWYVGVAQFSRNSPMWVSYTPNLWVNGTRYGFRGGIDDAAGASVDTYGNDSMGTLVLSGSSSSGSLIVTVRATFPAATTPGPSMRAPPALSRWQA